MASVDDESSEVIQLRLVEDAVSQSPRAAARQLIRVLHSIADEALTQCGVGEGLGRDEMRCAVMLRGAQAGFSGWGGHYGFAAGTVGASYAAAIELTSKEGIAAPGGQGPLMGVINEREWTDAVVSALAGREDPLARVKYGLSVTDEELGSMFGVSRQSVAQWLREGVPAARMAHLADMVNVVDLLTRKLKPGRLPLVARRPAERLEGRTLLEALRDDAPRTRAVFEEAFDWAATA